MILIVPILPNFSKHPKLLNQNEFEYIVVTFIKNKYGYSTLNTKEFLKFIKKQKETIYIHNLQSIHHVLPSNSSPNELKLQDTKVLLWSIDNTLEELYESDYEFNMYEFYDRLLNQTNIENISTFIPKLKKYEYARFLFDLFFKYYNEHEDKINTNNLKLANDKLHYLSIIGNNGIYISGFNKYLSKEKTINSFDSENNLLYNRYNIFNKTGRSTNSFDKLNFLAIPKEQRNVIASRFGDSGFLINIDQDSSHIRLAAKLVGYKNIPEDNTNAHIYLGKQYKKEHLPATYDGLKQSNFQNLYNRNDKLNYIPFFRRVDEYKDKLENMEEVVLNGATSYKINKKLDNNLKFNYTMQSIESEVFTFIIKLIQNKINELNLKSKIIINIYDSVVIDSPGEEKDSISHIIKEINKKHKLHLNTTVNNYYD